MDLLGALFIGFEPDENGAAPNNTFGAGIADAAGSLASDPDLDGVAAEADNCPEAANPSQADGDADGAGDACDCAPSNPAVFALPGVVPLGLTFDVTGTTLSWAASPGAVVHDLHRAGRSPGGPPPAAFSCDQADLGTVAAVPAAPGDGKTSYYVVTGRNCFGTGSAGTASDGSPRPLSPPCP